MLSQQQLLELRTPLLNIARHAGARIMAVYDAGELHIEHKPDNSPLTPADRNAHDAILQGLSDLTPEVPILSEEGQHLPFSERQRWQMFWLVDPLDGTKEFIKRNGEFTVNIALVENGEPVLGIVYAPDARIAWVGSRAGSAVTSGDSGHSLKLSDVDPTQTTAEIDPDTAGVPISVKNRDSDRAVIVASRSHMNDQTRNFIEEVSGQFTDVELITSGSSIKLCLVAEGRADLYPRYAPTMEWDTAAGHAIVRAAGGDVYRVDGTSEATHPMEPLGYNKENLLNPWFVARAW